MIPHSNTVFVSTTNGLYKTTNDGASWEQCYLNDSVTGIAYSTTYKTLFISTDNGVYYTYADASTLSSTWQKSEKGLTNQDCTSIIVDNTNNYVYTSTNGGGIYRAVINYAATDNIWIFYE